ncbi:hypothetical protein M422DRAFT_260101 [Sphaerobolus stellatus SS14]|uniref:Uncharacterized protein n=1 Tax=Sphaerobolus stellatus (strain SS14) TaxID=990650 RepID=A0A0C9URL8_SPHS4|nr:hypothetical protein M422DRAFT_260101 [Sphaerobolus stellatus SS14]
MSLANLLQSHYSRGGDGGEEEMPTETTIDNYEDTRILNLPNRYNYATRRRAVTGDYSNSSNESRYLSLHTPGGGSTSSAAPSASRLTVNVPRLRRGGIRAPESLPVAGDGYAHSVRISSPPIPGLLSTRRTEGRRRSSSIPSVRAGSEPLHPWAGHNAQISAEPTTSNGEARSTESTLELGGTADLPTPRSISPENSSGQN